MLTRFVAILILWATLQLPSGALFAQCRPPRPDHIVVVIEENHSLAQIIDSAAPPIQHVDQNRRAADQCPRYYPSQSTQLYRAVCRFHRRDYRQQLSARADGPEPSQYIGSKSGDPSSVIPRISLLSARRIVSSALYVRKHNPWVNWQSSPINQVPATENRPFSDFPTDFSTLPTLSIIVPNQQNDMHDGKDPDASNAQTSG